MWRGVCAHHYNYAYPGDQPEGIRRRVRQGRDGPTYLEPGANVTGHLHLPRGVAKRAGDSVVMGFRGENWVVVLDESTGHGNHKMIRQPLVGDLGYEIQGVVLRKATREDLG